jgi:hypothetical protein
VEGGAAHASMPRASSPSMSGARANTAKGEKAYISASGCSGMCSWAVAEPPPSASAAAAGGPSLAASGTRESGLATGSGREEEEARGAASHLIIIKSSVIIIQRGGGVGRSFVRSRRGANAGARSHEQLRAAE